MEKNEVRHKKFKKFKKVKEMGRKGIERRKEEWWIGGGWMETGTALEIMEIAGELLERVHRLVWAGTADTDAGNRDTVYRKIEGLSDIWMEGLVE